MRTLFVLLLLPTLSFGQKVPAPAIPAATFIDLFDKHIEDKAYLTQALARYGYFYDPNAWKADSWGLSFWYTYLPNVTTEGVRYLEFQGARTFSFQTQFDSAYKAWPADLASMGFKAVRQDSDSNSKYTYYEKVPLTVIVQDKTTPVIHAKRYFLRVRRG